jgi:precorrin isomerase
MDYAAFRQAGYPIGSGAIESGCKTVVQARMKQAGMRWSRQDAQAMLALRCLLLSDHWDELGTLTAPP